MVRGRHRGPSRRPVSRCSGSTHRAQRTLCQPNPRNSCARPRATVQMHVDARVSPVGFYDAMHPPRLVSVPFLESNPARCAHNEYVHTLPSMCVCVFAASGCSAGRRVKSWESKRVVLFIRGGMVADCRLGLWVWDGLTLLGELSLCSMAGCGAVPSAWQRRGYGVLADSDDRAFSLRLLPVTTRGLPYLNTMHYIVRVISYISRLNKHRLNI